MLIINQKPANFTSSDIKEFLEKNGYKDPVLFPIELKRHPKDFYRQAVVRSKDEEPKQIIKASVATKIAYSYMKDGEQWMWVDGYTPPIGNNNAVYKKSPDLTFHYTNPIFVKNTEFLMFIHFHPDREGSDLSKKFKNGRFKWLIHDREKEAKLKNLQRKHLQGALTKLDDLREKDNREHILATARGFSIANAHTYTNEVLLNKLGEIAEKNPSPFITRFATDEFRVTGVVYEATDLDIIKYYKSENCWKVMDTKQIIYTPLPNQDPHTSFIKYLINRDNDWFDQIKLMIEAKPKPSTDHLFKAKEEAVA